MDQDIVLHQEDKEEIDKIFGELGPIVVKEEVPDPVEFYDEPDLWDILYATVQMYKHAKAKREAIEAERKSLTAPYYSAKNEIEKEFRPRVDGAKKAERELQADAKHIAIGLVKGRHTFDTGDWVQVEQAKPTLVIRNLAALLKSPLVTALVSDVVLSKVAVAMAEEGQPIPGVEVEMAKSVKFHFEKEGK